MRRFVSFGPGFVVLAAATAVLALGPAMLSRLHLATIAASVQLAQARLDGGNALEALSQATRDVASATLPGVVHIRVRQAWGPRVIEDEDDAREPLRRFRPQASAAGWFWSEEGFIVTNAHVVQDADNLRVELYDGRVREARLIGADERTDIAVLKVDGAPGIVPARRATGVGVAVGERVFAFGSPFGIKFSMSQGIISGLGRSEAASLVGMSAGYTNFIQTDAAMNPGNSGGPLVDARGRVIGMSTAIANNVQYSGDGPPVQGQSAGIGFAIPLETIEAVVSQLIDTQLVIRGYLGITLNEYDPEEGRRIGIDYDGYGIVVTDLRAGHPADRAGLKVNDVIIKVAGVAATNPDVLRSLVSIRKAGEFVTIQLWRAGTLMDMDVRIGAAYFTRDGRREDLRYVPGSEDMAWDEVRRKVRSEVPERVD